MIYVSKSQRIPSRKTCRLTVTTIGRRVDDWNFIKKEKKRKYYVQPLNLGHDARGAAAQEQGSQRRYKS
jgi:hypothetical protein